MREGRIVAALVSTLVLAMAGTMTFQALIPTFIAAWGLSHSEAGWISGVAYAGHVAAAPFLMGLSDRVDARRIVLVFLVLAALSALGFAFFAEGFWSAMLFQILNGVALAGTYMPGLRALSDRVEGPHRSRFQALYTANFSIGTAFSLLLAGLVADRFGWPMAFAAAGLAPLAALPLVLALPPAIPAGRAAGGRPPLLELRPVLKNREAMGYIVAYGAHAWELFGYRTWLVAFMTFAAASSGAAVGEAAIAGIATVLLMLGLPASVLGNEAAMRLGRRRVLVAFMLLSAALALSIAFTAALPFEIVVAALALYSAAVMLDSASITVGTVDAAEPERRGATMAVHTTLGSAMAFLSPFLSGVVIDLTGGGASVGSWLAGFAVLAAGVAIGPLALLVLVPAERRRKLTGASG